MIRLAIAILVAVAALSVACSRKDASLNGKFLLAARPINLNAYDAIEFLPDGNCVVTSGNDSLAGSVRQYDDGRLMIEVRGLGNMAAIYKAQISKRTICLKQDGMIDLYYVRMPDPPHPEVNQLIGMYFVHSDREDWSSDVAYELMANQRYRSNMRFNSTKTKEYREIPGAGKWYYSNGVIIYHPDPSEKSLGYTYQREIVVKRDKKGLWALDPVTDSIICASVSTTLDLPSPPANFRRQP